MDGKYAIGTSLWIAMRTGVISGTIIDVGDGELLIDSDVGPIWVPQHDCFGDVVDARSRLIEKIKAEIERWNKILEEV